MKTYIKLKKFGSKPFTHSAILSLLEDYKNPNEKIRNMVKNGEIIRIKRELYLNGHSIREKEISIELVANLVYGPSYISLEWALAHYGLIPEKIYEVTSICNTNTPKIFETPIGRFKYIKSKKELFDIGILSEQNNDDSYFLIASKEKALCDKIIYTPNLQITSIQEIQTFLEDDLRIDIEELNNFDTEIIRECLEVGFKKRMLAILLELTKKVKG